MGTRCHRVVLVLTAVTVALALFASAQAAPVMGAVAYGAPGPGDAVNTRSAVAYYVDDARSETWITIGQRHGLRPGAELAFFRGGQEVARGTAVTVRDCDTVVKPAEGTPGGAMRLGDSVQVVTNGSREAADRALEQQRRRSEAGTAFFTALLTIAIAVAR